MTTPSSIIHQSNANLDTVDQSVTFTAIAISATANDQHDVLQPLNSTSPPPQRPLRLSCSQLCFLWRQPAAQRLVITALIVLLIILVETLLPTVGREGIAHKVLSALAHVQNVTDGSGA
jgi:hypothetical protein